jgi:hypothetical protein
MSGFIEIAGPNVKAKKSEHESGTSMLVFRPFVLAVPSVEAAQRIFSSALALLDPHVQVMRVCLEARQVAEKSLLEELGFVVDGFEYGVEISRLSQLGGSDRLRLPADFSVRRMVYHRDIEMVVALEKTTHAADPTSRVSFETTEAVASMKNYYRRVSETTCGVYLLMRREEVVGLVGFMPDQQREGAVHISSVSIDLSLQGNGLFFPFLLSCLNDAPFAKYRQVTGVTTTERLLSLANKYSIDLLGLSLCKIGLDALVSQLQGQFND